MRPSSAGQIVLRVWINKSIGHCDPRLAVWIMWESYLWGAELLLEIWKVEALKPIEIFVPSSLASTGPWCYDSASVCNAMESCLVSPDRDGHWTGGNSERTPPRSQVYWSRQTSRYKLRVNEWSSHDDHLSRLLAEHLLLVELGERAHLVGRWTSRTARTRGTTPRTAPPRRQRTRTTSPRLPAEELLVPELGIQRPEHGYHLSPRLAFPHRPQPLAAGVDAVGLSNTSSSTRSSLFLAANVVGTTRGRRGAGIKRHGSWGFSLSFPRVREQYVPCRTSARTCVWLLSFVDHLQHSDNVSWAQFLSFQLFCSLMIRANHPLESRDFDGHKCFFKMLVMSRQQKYWEHELWWRIKKPIENWVVYRLKFESFKNIYI
jgi:hypothetical protein